jgi:hypothetical protein
MYLVQGYNPPLVFSGILNGRTTNLHPVGLGNLFDSFFLNVHNHQLLFDDHLCIYLVMPI